MVDAGERSGIDTKSINTVALYELEAGTSSYLQLPFNDKTVVVAGREPNQHFIDPAFRRNRQALITLNQDPTEHSKTYLPELAFALSHLDGRPVIHIPINEENMHHPGVDVSIPVIRTMNDVKGKPDHTQFTYVSSHVRIGQFPDAISFIPGTRLTYYGGPVSEPSMRSFLFDTKDGNLVISQFPGQWPLPTDYVSSVLARQLRKHTTRNNNVEFREIHDTVDNHTLIRAALGANNGAAWQYVEGNYRMLNTVGSIPFERASKIDSKLSKS